MFPSNLKAFANTGIKILTYNLDMRSTKDKNIFQRTAAVLDFIRQQKPSVICFQEHGNAARGLYFSLGGLGYNLYPGSRDICTYTAPNVQVQQHHNVPFISFKYGGPLISKESLIGKGCTITTVTIPGFRSGRNVCIANAHLEPHGKNAGMRDKQFSKIVTALSSSSASIQIVAGDLNDPNAGRFAQQYGFSADSGSFVTHHHETNVRRKENRDAARKDWVMSRGAVLIPNSAQTVRLGFGTQNDDISDHSPVVAKII